MEEYFEQIDQYCQKFRDLWDKDKEMHFIRLKEECKRDIEDLR